MQPEKLHFSFFPQRVLFACSVFLNTPKRKVWGLLAEHSCVSVSVESSWLCGSSSNVIYKMNGRSWTTPQLLHSLGKANNKPSLKFV